MEVFERLDNERKCIVFVIDIVVGDVKEEFKIKFLNKVFDDFLKIMGLVGRLLIVENLFVEICINVDVEDGFINGIFCIVKKLDFRVENFSRCSIIWVEFESLLIGVKIREKYIYLYFLSCKKIWILILEIIRNFNVG